MGLDMYLTARIYVPQGCTISEDGTFIHPGKPDPRFDPIISAIGAKDLIDSSNYGTMSVHVPVGYWRKANAIHGWFVRNVQDGVDDCGSYLVDRDKLKELREACTLAMENPLDAVSILPPQDGFFFGSTSIDDYYREDLQLTISIIDRVLPALERRQGWSIPELYYEASW